MLFVDVLLRGRGLVEEGSKPLDSDFFPDQQRLGDKPSNCHALLHVFAECLNGWGKGDRKIRAVVNRLPAVAETHEEDA